MDIHMLLYLGVLLLSGLLCGRLVKQVKLPNVTGYLLAGLILGPSLLGFLSGEVVSELSILSDIALGFIAFSIGGEFKLSYFKRVGMTPVVIAALEALGACVVVAVAVLCTGVGLPTALILGAIASATAPAATIMVIKQYKAKGPVTETLLSVVAIDDAAALLLFGFAVATVNALTQGGGSLLSAILSPFLEILISIVVGAVLAGVCAFLLRYFKKDSNVLIIATAGIFTSVGLASLLGGSTLLTCMLYGAIFVNVTRKADGVLKLADSVTSPIYLLFFAVSGAGLDISIIPQIGVIGVVYVFTRVIGKMAGATLGGALCKAPAAVRKYLGPALVPQAGVAIGLTLVAQQVVPEHAQIVRAVVLCGTFIYEIVGPVITKVSLTKAGEIVDEGKPSKPGKGAATPKSPSLQA